MLELVERLERMGRINRDIRLATSNASPRCDRLVALRGDFNFECSQMLNRLTAHLACHVNARAISRIQDDILSMHQMLAQHQQRWSVFEIERDPASYAAQSKSVHVQVIHYLEQAHAALAAISDGPNPALGAPSDPFAPEARVRLIGLG